MPDSTAGAGELPRQFNDPCSVPEVSKAKGSSQERNASPREPAGPTDPFAQACCERLILIADDERNIRVTCRYLLEADGIQCDEAVDGLQVLEAASARPYDLIILDVDMPKMRGTEVCHRLRATCGSPHLKIMMVSGRSTSDELATMLQAGADDYLAKPFSALQLQARVKALLRLKDAQERSNQLNRNLLEVNSDLEKILAARNSDLIHARNAFVLALAKLTEYRDYETGDHLRRLQMYSTCLAETVANYPMFVGQIDRNFIDMLGCCAPLHDIGKVGLPDAILLKPGRLDAGERRVMERHPIIGYNTLRAVAEQHGFARPLLQMGMDIARHHHERFDGQGYPDRLLGAGIPLPARLVAVADVYDALRSRRVYKPPFTHEEASAVITESSGGQFDPALVRGFIDCAPQFNRIFEESCQTQQCSSGT